MARIALSVAIVFAGLIGDAFAHSWYPPECCSGNDCDVIAESRVRPAFAGYMIDGVHYIPMGQVRRSPDNDFHGCFPVKDKLGCFWAPVQGS